MHRFDAVFTAEGCAPHQDIVDDLDELRFRLRSAL
jgi:hypothetical protein